MSFLGVGAGADRVPFMEAIWPARHHIWERAFSTILPRGWTGCSKALLQLSAPGWN
jgi:hypothetical protein